jgi:hypothetical protein
VSVIIPSFNIRATRIGPLFFDHDSPPVLDGLFSVRVSLAGAAIDEAVVFLDGTYAVHFVKKIKNSKTFCIRGNNFEKRHIARVLSQHHNFLRSHRKIYLAYRKNLKVLTHRDFLRTRRNFV